MKLFFGWKPLLKYGEIIVTKRADFTVRGKLESMELQHEQEIVAQV